MEVSFGVGLAGGSKASILILALEKLFLQSYGDVWIGLYMVGTLAFKKSMLEMDSFESLELIEHGLHSKSSESSNC